MGQRFGWKSMIVFGAWAVVALAGAWPAEAVGIGMNNGTRIVPRDPVNRNGPTGWACDAQGNCQYLYAPDDDCFKWFANPASRGFCVFLDGYEIEFDPTWWARRCLWQPCDGMLHKTLRLSVAPDISGEAGAVHTALDIGFSNDESCTGAGLGCVSLPVGTAAGPSVFEAEDGMATTIDETRFSVLVPTQVGASCTP